MTKFAPLLSTPDAAPFIVIVSFIYRFVCFFLFRATSKSRSTNKLHLQRRTRVRFSYRQKIAALDPGHSYDFWNSNVYDWLERSTKGFLRLRQLEILGVTRRTADCDCGPVTEDQYELDYGWL